MAHGSSCEERMPREQGEAQLPWPPSMAASVRQICSGTSTACGCRLAGFGSTASWMDAGSRACYVSRARESFQGFVSAGAFQRGTSGSRVSQSLRTAHQHFALAMEDRVEPSAKPPSGLAVPLNESADSSSTGEDVRCRPSPCSSGTGYWQEWELPKGDNRPARCPR